MKIKANPTAPYSTLNPETSSDSPSAKSKGVRFNSAIQVVSQNRNRGPLINKGLIVEEGTSFLKKYTLPQPQKRANARKLSLISYLIVWATARSPPNKAYFLLAPQPAPNKG